MNDRMHRPFFLPIVWLIIVVCSLSIYSTSCSPGASFPSSYGRYVPDDAIWILCSPDAHAGETLLPDSLRMWCSRLNADILIAAYCPVGQGITDWLLLGEVREKKNVGTSIGAPAFAVEGEWTYSGHKIRILDAKDAQKVTFSHLGRKRFVLSFRTALVEEALEQSGKVWQKALVKLPNTKAPQLCWRSDAWSDLLPSAAQGVEGIFAVEVRDTLSFPVQVHVHPFHRTRPVLSPMPFFEETLRICPEGVLSAEAPAALNPAASPYWKRYIAPWAGAQPIAIQFPGASGSGQTQAVLVSIKEEASASENLQAYSDAVGVFRDYDYQSFRIIQVMDAGLAAVFHWSEASSLAFTVVERRVVFAPSTELLERWIDYLRAGATLEQHFAAWMPASDERALFWKYVAVPTQAPTWLSAVIPVQKGFLLGAKKRSGRMVLELTPLQEFAEQHNPSALWRVGLPAPIVRFFPLDGHPFVAVYDSLGYLSLFEQNAGQQIWKAKLDGLPLSSPFWVEDGLGGVKGWLLNTRNTLYFFSERGDSNPGFPKALRVPASAGLTPVQLPGQQPYFYFPAANGRIYGYQTNGTPLMGWDPGPVVGEVSIPMVFFTHQGKDYLTGVDVRGRLFALKAGGGAHFAPVALFSRAPVSLEADKSGPAPRLVASDGTGRIRVANASGEHFPLAVIPGGEAVQALFVWADVLGDARKDYIMLHGSYLTVATYQGQPFKTVWSKDLGQVFDQISIVPGLEKSYIGLFREASREFVVLHGDTGAPLSGFPLGSTCGLKWDEAQQLAVTVYEQTLLAYRMPEH